jgi:transposase-like protein
MSAGPKRQWTDRQKKAAVARIQNGMTVAQMEKKLDVHGSVVYGWLRKFGKTKAPPKKKSNGHASHDALIYLRHAHAAMQEHPDRALDDDVYLFTRLALRAMEKRA